MNLREHVIVNDPKSYGSDYQAHCLEMYRIYVEMADNISGRRQSANSFFLSVNTAILAVFGLSEGPFREWLWCLSLAGVVLSYSWYRLIKSYKDLNTAKFKVVHEMESVLPFSPYDAEWEAVGRGERSDLYLPFTHIEIRIPWVFVVIHTIVGFVLLRPIAAEIVDRLSSST